MPNRVIECFTPNHQKAGVQGAYLEEELLFCAAASLRLRTLEEDDSLIAAATGRRYGCTAGALDSRVPGVLWLQRKMPAANICVLDANAVRR